MPFESPQNKQQYCIIITLPVQRQGGGGGGGGKMVIRNVIQLFRGAS